MTMENAPANRRAFYGQLMAMGSPISQVAANLILAVQSGVFDDQPFDPGGRQLSTPFGCQESSM